jgi:hypothetical protein
VRVLRIEQVETNLEIVSGYLPYRDARDKGPFDVIPAKGFWLTTLRPGESPPDPTILGAHLMVVLSGQVRVGQLGEQLAVLESGDVACVDVASGGLLRLDWESDVWLFFVLTPGWLPEPGDNQARPDSVARPGRPLLTWIYDDAGSSRSQPFSWPARMTPVPAPGEWPKSRGAFVTRRDYGDNGYAPGVWHNGPRSQLGFTLNGLAENETGDGTVTRPVSGDMAYIDDVTGKGHVTRGQGDRWMLFVTVVPGELRLVAER